MGLGGADAGARVGELREAWVTEALFDQGDEGVRVLFVTPPCDGEIVDDGEAGGGEGAFHENLVEPERRAEHTGADVWQVGELEQALDGPVFTVEPVEHGEDDIDRWQSPIPSILSGHERVLCRVGR